MKYLVFSIIVTLFVLPAVGQEETAVKQLPQRSPDFMPLGVYWPGEFTFRNKANKNAPDWKKVEEVLDSLKAHHVNAVWLTHVSPAEGAQFARLAAKRGIYLVASLGNLAGNVPHIRRGNHAKQIQTTLQAWGDAPPPIMWGLGDEPRASYMHEMQPYAAAWRQAGQPVTTVVMAGDVPSAVELCRLNAVCSDIYPYFSAGNPNGPDNFAESVDYLNEAVESMVRRTGNHQKMKAWFMGAVFQEPWGARNYDDKGNIIYYPGAGPHFRMPTPAEVKWQNWAAVASGARGIFLFSLIFAPGKPGPDPAPMPEDKRLPFGVKEKWNSGAPGGILYPDGRPTPQYEAMGECFGRLAKVSALIQQLRPSDQFVAFHSKGWPRVGDLVRTFQDDKDNWYAVVVSGELKKEDVVPVNIIRDVETVTDLVSGADLPPITKPVHSWEPIGKPFRQVRVKLAPGSGTILRLQLKANAKPAKDSGKE